MIRSQTPNNILVTYMAAQLDCRRILDIGSHSLANALWLRERGYDVTTVDKDDDAWANWHCDIKHAPLRPETFSHIIDINTLCHVRDAPYDKIHDWLKPYGKFFSIHPAMGTDDLVKFGKKYTRLPTEQELRDSLKMFTQVAIYPAEYPHFPGQLRSWVVEARK